MFKNSKHSSVEDNCSVAGEHRGTFYGKKNQKQQQQSSFASVPNVFIEVKQKISFMPCLLTEEWL